MRLGLLLITSSALAAATTGFGNASPLAKRLTGPAGIDVSNWQKTIDWGKLNGVAFAYIKATEGTGTAYFRPPPFAPVIVPHGQWFDPRLYSRQVI